MEDEGDEKLQAKALSKKLLGKAGVDALTAKSVKSAVTGAGFKIVEDIFEENDGLARTTFVAEHAAGAAFRLEFLDFSLAAKGERLLIDGERYLTVAVCRDCEARKSGLIEGMKETSKAKKLLKRLSAP